MSLFYNQLDLILPSFTQAEQTYIRDLVDFSADHLSPEEEYILLKMIRSITESTIQQKKDFLIDIFEKVYVRQAIPSMYFVNAGEDFILTIKIRKTQDLSGSFITIRQDDGTLLSADDVAGTDDATQTVSIIDVSLTPYTFYKLRILSEAPSGSSTASGDVLTVLDTIYLYVDEDVDTT